MDDVNLKQQWFPTEILGKPINTGNPVQDQLANLHREVKFLRSLMSIYDEKIKTIEDEYTKRELELEMLREQNLELKSNLDKSNLLLQDLENVVSRQQLEIKEKDHLIDMWKQETKQIWPRQSNSLICNEPVL